MLQQYQTTEVCIYYLESLEQGLSAIWVFTYWLNSFSLTLYLDTEEWHLPTAFKPDYFVGRLQSSFSALAKPIPVTLGNILEFVFYSLFLCNHHIYCAEWMS